MTDWHEIDNQLTDPAWYGKGDSHRTFKLLRDEDPVHWTQDDRYGRHYWTLTRHEDIKNYLLDDQLYSNRIDTRIPRSSKRRTPEQRHQLGFDVLMTANDNPLHDLYRRPLNKHFSVPAVGRLKSQIDAVVDGIIAEACERDEVDVVDNIAEELSARVILTMLGAPPEDWDMLREATSQKMAAADPRYIIDNDHIKTYQIGAQRLYDYSQRLTQERRKDPKDDLATVIAQMQIDGDPLSPHESATYCSLMISGGLESTRNTAAVGLWAFMNNPEQRTLLLEDPSLTKSTVEEVIRWVSPGSGRLRVATRDFELHGKTIRQNDWIIAFLASANRDERVFENPEKFDIRRNPNPHLGLGEGLHMCLGRNLARLELASFFPKFLRAFPDIELTADPEWIPDANVTGFRTMPVRLNTPALV
ncbi:cytochrome P450 [Arthrobacter sp. AZCC_0090]|uniref:cytochrome P450 n=1 Tax=Arthrobacter sp. AZCC_0090 TaxID=2735881 RepID=UPI00160D6D58|nr:cytochrome P450 [Arthrobacter sp. AZCC_0090]MBB6407152.1 cytochrome P450 [Arthrobacter sp. AZCC_0090]